MKDEKKERISREGGLHLIILSITRLPIIYSGCMSLSLNTETLGWTAEIGMLTHQVNPMDTENKDCWGGGCTCL